MSATQEVSNPTTPVAKEQKKPQVKKQSTHPKFIEMIQLGLKHLNERTGSSRVALMKYIVATYKLDEKMAKTHLKLALIKGVKDGVLKQVKGSGSNGSFKLVPVVKKTQEKKVVKAEKKPTTEKKQTKKTPSNEEKPKKNIKKIVKPKIPKVSAAEPKLEKVKADKKAKSAKVETVKSVKTITKKSNAKQAKPVVKKSPKAATPKTKKN